MEEKQRGCLPDLPLEVWKEILLRVPAESLVHFKRVCKAWCGLIDSDRFVESHLEHWRPRDIILCKGMRDIALVPLSFNGDEQHKSHLSERWLRDCLINALPELREGVAQTCRTRFKGAHLQVLDSCDGLILFRVCFAFDVERQLLVCNPITKSFVLLPPCYSIFDMEDPKWTIVGNGASSQEYKIIGIPRKHPIRSPRLMTYFVFDLRRGGGREPSSWKELHMDVPWNCLSRLLGPVLSIGRKVHWLIELVHDEEVVVLHLLEKQRAETVLLSLDLSTERLSHTRILSEEPAFKGWTESWLYSDRVMCSVWDTPSSEDLELWVLEDVDCQPIWRKRRAITRLPEGSKFIMTGQWRGVFMEAEGEIVIDDGLGYSVSSRVWRKMIDLDSAHHLPQLLCHHVHSLLKFD